jgi:hypothetical protein
MTNDKLKQIWNELIDCAIWVQTKDYYVEGKLKAYMLGLIDNYIKLEPLEDNIHSCANEVQIAVSSIIDYGIAS